MPRKRRVASKGDKANAMPDPVAKPAAQAIKEIEAIVGCRVLVYAAERSIGPWDVTPLYSLLETIGHQGKLAVIIQSAGGYPDDAFKMANIIREFADYVTFVVPSYANSAATLMCLSGDVIQMGPVSELGPTNPMMYVDERLITPMVPQPSSGDGTDKPKQPRQRQMAAHALRDFLTASGVLQADGKGYNAEVLSVYVSKGVLNPFLLGDFERSGKVALQYAETLLLNYMFKERKDKGALAEEVARHLCEGYFDHSYPIGRKEAREVLQLNVEDMSKELWKSSSELMQAYDQMIAAQNIASLIETTQEFRITHWAVPTASA